MWAKCRVYQRQSYWWRVSDITLSIDKFFLISAVFSFFLDNTKFGFVMTVRIRTTAVWRAGTSVAGGRIADILRAESKTRTKNICWWKKNSAASSRLNWRPCRCKWTRPFRRKSKSGFCACHHISNALYLSSYLPSTCSSTPECNRLCINCITCWNIFSKKSIHEAGTQFLYITSLMAPIARVPTFWFSSWDIP